MDPALRLGVDLGGTKTEAVVLRLEAEAPRVLARRRIPTQRDAGYAHVVAATARLVADVARDAGLAAPPPVGVGMPGGVTFRRADGTRSERPLVKNSNTTCLNGQPFRDDLPRALRELHPGSDLAATPVFANDANCFALAEAKYGPRAAHASRSGSSWAPASAAASPSARATTSGRGTAPRGSPASGGTSRSTPRAIDPATAAGAAASSSSSAARPSRRPTAGGPARPPRSRRSRRERRTTPTRATIDAVVEAFGRAIATVIDILDPDAIVLGGGVSNLDVFYDRGPAAVARWVFDDELRTPIVKHALGDSAGVLGAALLERIR